MSLENTNENTPTNPKLFTTNFPDDWDSGDIEELFAKFGNVEKVALKRGFAYVTYQTLEEAIEAQDKLDEFDIDGKKLVVSPTEDMEPPAEKPKDQTPAPENNLLNNISSMQMPNAVPFDISQAECYICHQKGHFARDCPINPVKFNRGNQNNFRGNNRYFNNFNRGGGYMPRNPEIRQIKCYNCQGFGHHAKDCINKPVARFPPMAGGPPGPGGQFPQNKRFFNPAHNYNNYNNYNNNYRGMPNTRMPFNGNLSRGRRYSRSRSYGRRDSRRYSRSYSRGRRRSRSYSRGKRSYSRDRRRHSRSYSRDRRRHSRSVGRNGIGSPRDRRRNSGIGRNSRSDSRRRRSYSRHRSGSRKNSMRRSDSRS